MINPYVQLVTSDVSPADGTTETIPIKAYTQQGHTLILNCRTFKNITGISDSQGNTWVIDSNTNNANQQNSAIGRAYLSHALTPSDTITVTLSATGNFPHFMVHEYQNLMPLSFDTQNKGSAISVTSQATGSTATLAQSIELVITTLGLSNVATITTPSGFTLRSGGANTFAVLADLITTTTAAKSATWTWDNTVNSGACIAAYKINPTTTTLNNFQFVSVGDGMSVSEKIR